MKADIQLDTDAYNIASAYASARGISLGEAISQLVRRAEGLPETSSAKLIESKRGLLVRAKEGRTVTPATVREFSEDDFG